MTEKSKSLVLPVMLGLVGLIILAAILFPVFGTAGHRAKQGLNVAGGSRIVLESPTESYDSASAVKTTAPGGSWDAVYASSMERLVIKTATLSMETSSIDKTQEKITEATRKSGGFITDSSVNNNDSEKGASLTIRVSAVRYASLLNDISKMGKVTEKKEEGEDVTEEYVDLDSRLRNLRREEEQFLKVLTKANRVTDILAVENELARVRGQIEESVGRMKYLQNQVSLSTITVELSEPAPIVANIVKWDIGRTAKGASNALLAVFRWLMSVVVWLVVFIPLWALIGVVVRGIKKYQQKSRQ